MLLKENGLKKLKANKKRFVYLISPNKIYKSFYTNLKIVLSYNLVSFFQLRLKHYSLIERKKIGIKINKPKNLRNLSEYFFGEDQSRYVLEIDQNELNKVEKILQSNNIYYENIGKTQRDFFEIEGEMKASVNDLFKVNNQWYNNY